MVNKPLARKLLRDLWQRKGALFALILVLIIGVANYVGMKGVAIDLDSARANYYYNYNLASFTLDLKRASEAEVKRLENLPNIIRLRSRVKTDAMVMLPPKSYIKNPRLIPGTAMSLPVPRRNIVNNIKLVTGTWFSSPYAREVIVDQQFAKARHLQVGDRIEVRLPDQSLQMLIVGSAISPEFTIILAPGSIATDPGGLAVMYMPRKFLQQYADLNGSFNQLLGMTRDNSDIAINNTMALLSSKLENYGVQLQTAQRDQQSVQILRNELVQVDKTAEILPGMFFLVAMLILNVMITRLVTQQRSAIGTLKALGYSNFAITRHYLGFGLVVGLLGGILGCVGGYGLQYLMLELYKLYFVMPDMVSNVYFNVIMQGMLISVGSALLGAVNGTIKAVRLAPVEAMRPPVPEKSVHILLEKLPGFWKSLSFQNKMVMRAIFRNRFRSLVTIVASILATALIVSSLGFLDTIDEMINFSFDTVQHQDYDMVLREPLGKDILSTLRILPGVQKVESQLSVAAELKNSPYKKRLEVIGLPANNELFTPVDKHKNIVRIPKSGLVLNETLAEMLHVKPGDEVILRPLIGNRTSSRVIVTNIIKTYLGLAAYANQIWLSRLLGNSYATNHILFKLKKGADENKFIRATAKFAPMISLNSRRESKELMINTIEEFLTFSIIILIFFAGSIAIGSMLNTSIISLNERERDVASLRVLGFTNVQTWKIFFGESVILNCLGIFLGLFAGIYFIYYMSVAFSNEIFRMPMVVNLVRLFETALLMFIFVIVAQIFIYQIIKKLNWFAVLNVME